MKRDKGVITVFLALIFSILFSFLCVTIDITRINSAKNQLIIATDAAITSVLSSFNQDLYNSYGIFAFDSSKDYSENVKDIINQNITDSSLFNIKVEEISTQASGNPFTDNNIMKKQMINAMKYKGTENLALSVFDKLKNILDVKDAIADNEKIEQFEETKEKQELDYKLAVVEQGKIDAYRAIIELAKNSTFDELTSSSIGWVGNKVSKEKLDNIKNSNNIVKEALENGITKDNPYKDKSYVHNIYSYNYTKAILQLYYEYSKGIYESASNNETVEIETPTPERILELIQYGDTSLKPEYKESFEKLSSKLGKLQSYNEKKFLILKGDKYGISVAIDILTDLITNNKEYLELIETYNDVESEHIKVSSKESVDEYQKLLDINKLKSYKEQLIKVNNQIEKVKQEVSQYNVNEIITDNTKEWIRDNLDRPIFKILDKEISSNIKSRDFDIILINKICKNEEIKKELKNITVINKLFTDKLIQIKTLDGLTDKLNLDTKPESENVKKFKDFLKSFEDIKNDKKNSSIKDILKKYPISEDTIDKQGLPSKSSESEELTKISKELANLSTNNIKPLDNFGSLLEIADGTIGEILDNVYLVEYVMTNFKDILNKDNEGNIVNPDRIPKMTANETVLNFEIEAIISGKYNDKKSRNTMVSDLMLYRTAINMMNLAGGNQPQIKRFISSAANIISIATQKTVPSPIIKYSLMAGWSILEARYDVIDLFNGKETPIIKDGLDEWVTKLGLESETLISVDKTNENSLSSVIDIVGDVESNKPMTREDSNSYNQQGTATGFDYTDFLRLRLLCMDKDDLIDRCQDIIFANLKNNNKLDSYDDFSTELELGINKSNVNILFNSEYFSDKSNKFNSFSFKRSYN